MQAHAELHCHSAYSFGDGASLPAELAATAAELGYSALALTDHDGLWGAMEFAQACKPLGLKSIVGTELTLDAHDPCHVTLLVESPAGWRNLCHLVTDAHAGTRPKPGRDPLPPLLEIDRLAHRTEGLVCLSGCARDGAAAGRWERGEPRAAERLARRLLALFGPDRFRIELQRPLWRRDRARNRWLEQLGERLGVPCVATSDAHAHDSSRVRLQDALVAGRYGAGLDETEARRRGNSSSVLASPHQLAERFRDQPAALAEAERLAERLEFDLTRDLGYRYPGSEDPGADRELARLCRARLDERYRPSPHRSKAKARLEEELGLIRSLKLSGFFLLHHDMLELAREVAVEVRGRDSVRALLPPGRGRGSSVSSIVCYLTGLSHCDPVANDLFLGRFLNEELRDVPDIDLDFPRDVRERLIPRVHERYGHERSALVAAFATYRTRGAVRDLGKALGLPLGEIERLARSCDAYGTASDVVEEIETALGPHRCGQPRWRALAELTHELLGLPRHVSQHPGGMVISTGRLIDLCPVQPAAMEGRQIVQWDKDSCSDAGFLKIDLLGLGMLSAVERCVEEIARARGERIDLTRIPLDDKPVWEAIQQAETTGVFQIESRAQMQMLPRTLPENLDDLTVQVALVRPGPIQGGAVHPYIERRKRLREDPSYEVPYEHPSLEPVLRDTLGAIVFQDQVLEVAIALAGFSPGEAEGLRRAMSRKRSEAALRAYHERFVAGAVGRGVEREVAERVYAQIQGFSGFGFPKAHSVAFGLLAYQSTWLRVHYGPELLCSLLNEQPMGFYPPDALVHEAQRRGIEVRGPDINESFAECRVEPAGSANGDAGAGLAVRIGLGYVAEVAEDDVGMLVAERERGGPYESLADLAARAGPGSAALERLAWSGACDRLASAPASGLRPDYRSPSAPWAEEARSRGGAGPSRRAPLWTLGGSATARREPEGTQIALPLEGAKPPRDRTGRPLLPELEPWERIVADYGSTRMTLGEHPMALLRGDLPGSASSSRELEGIRDGSRIELAGMVVARQRPATAKGVVFMLLEDEWGVINLVIPPPVAKRHRLVVRTAGFVRAWGKLERREGVINLVVSRLDGMARPQLPDAEVRSIEPPPGRETGREDGTGGRDARVVDLVARRASAAAELAAALPAAHSFGRRGR